MFLSVLGFIFWSFAYFVWPRWSFDDGPFFAAPFGETVSGLPVLSSTGLRLFEKPVFVLEARISEENPPRTVFVLKGGDGVVRWIKAAATEFGRIRFGGQQWFIPEGWIVWIQPEGHESGELYLSPFGGFRCFLLGW